MSAGIKPFSDPISPSSFIHHGNDDFMALPVKFHSYYQSVKLEDTHIAISPQETVDH